jgi:hypothetical protein
MSRCRLGPGKASFPPREKYSIEDGGEQAVMESVYTCGKVRQVTRTTMPGRVAGHCLIQILRSGGCSVMTLCTCAPWALMPGPAAPFPLQPKPGRRSTRASAGKAEMVRGCCAGVPVSGVLASSPRMPGARAHCGAKVLIPGNDTGRLTMRHQQVRMCTGTKTARAMSYRNTHHRARVWI